MLLSSNLRKQVKLSLTSKTKIVFNETIEFSVVVSPKEGFCYNLHIEDVKGKFTNLRVGSINSQNYLPFDQSTGTYQTSAAQLLSPYNFVIEFEAKFKAITSLTWSAAFYFSGAQLKFLNVFECYEGKLDFANYEFYKLQWFIKKVEEGTVEITIKNPDNIQINGKVYFSTFYQNCLP
uniref:Uncharacterized protein n=1 Tax=Panagrolaimus sp. PS1159 TaxID=55785 RepID=A0AC35GNA8_9BILA